MQAQVEQKQVGRQQHKKQMEVLIKTLADHKNVPFCNKCQYIHTRILTFDNSTEFWENYWERFCTFIAANSIPEGRKPQVLLTNQTTTIYKLSTNLAQQQTPPQKINEPSMEKIIEFMAKNYDPKRFLIRDRYNLWHDMKRKPGRLRINSLLAFAKTELHASFWL